ncbi:hypothetical protein [Brachyspira pilosicoli]|uniref:hypothetical protein n=1 Tax=Brachyspira pilosicoli TaxID=52584 RepID=UPI00255CA048|nr:hypothetical protein [Brachyspira pilosicoli]
MEGLRFIKIIFSFFILLLVIFFLISCQSPLFQAEYNAENDLSTNTQYHGKYISKNNVGRNPNEKLNVLITNDNGVGIYMWIGGSSFPVNDSQRFDIKSSDIDGDFPHYAFNNDELVGKLTIVNNNVITISFAKLLPPYLNIQNVTCNKTQ